MSDRTVILHYHLFKNAGTSIDAMLQKNFGAAWVTKEFAPAPGGNTEKVVEWIRSEPEAIAFSSHTMTGPIPRIDGVRIVTVLMLRNPLKRISSAYRFERTQFSEAFGAVLARHTTFEGYVRSRLALPTDRQCRNFQTARLASMCPGKEPELDRACRGLDQIDVVGRVEKFSRAVRVIEHILKPHFPDFRSSQMHTNKSPVTEKLMDDELRTLLRKHNRDDFLLLKYFDNEIDAALKKRLVQRTT